MDIEMRVDLPGLMRERMGSGRFRYRVRMEGNKSVKITLPCGPDHPDFLTFYEAARRGQKSKLTDPRDATAPKSVAWLTYGFEEYMRQQVADGLLHRSTEQQRSAFYARLRDMHGGMHMEMPKKAVVALRDQLSATPGAADNMVKAIRALYAWAIDRGHVVTNPASDVRKINRSKGAVPWSIDDLKQFRERHPHGTMPHLALTLFTFTACRLGDVYLLSRKHEIRRDGQRHLTWQPEKKGSAKVTVPILPPLAKAIEAQKVIGETYLLNAHGQPFASKNAFGKWFRKRVLEAGLEGRSPHGIRKASGELLALSGASQYHIMAVHGHTQAKTSEVYTSGVNRETLAREAMKMMANMDW